MKYNNTRYNYAKLIFFKNYLRIANLRCSVFRRGGDRLCFRLDVLGVTPRQCFPVAGGWWLQFSLHGSRLVFGYFGWVTWVLIVLGGRETFFNFELISYLILGGEIFLFCRKR